MHSARQVKVDQLRAHSSSTGVQECFSCPEVQRRLLAALYSSQHPNVHNESVPVVTLWVSHADTDAVVYPSQRDQSSPAHSLAHTHHVRVHTT